MGSLDLEVGIEDRWVSLGALDPGESLDDLVDCLESWHETGGRRLGSWDVRIHCSSQVSELDLGAWKETEDVDVAVVGHACLVAEDRGDRFAEDEA